MKQSINYLLQFKKKKKNSSLFLNYMYKNKAIVSVPQ